MPLGLLSVLASSPGSRLRMVTAAARDGLLLSLAVECMQVFVMSRTSDVADVLVGGLGAAGGALLSAPFRKTVASPTGEAAARLDLALLFLSGYLVFLVAYALAPFRFITDPRAIAHKLRHQSVWIPFSEHIDARSLATWRDLGKEIGLFVPVGALLLVVFRAAGRPAKPALQLALTVLLAGVVGSALELAQAATVNHTTDVTDALCHVAGAVLGLLLAFPVIPPGRGGDG